MKKCEGCRFFIVTKFRQYNFCLFFYRGMMKESKCISEKKYFNYLREVYLQLDNDNPNLMEKINNPDFKYNLFSYWNLDICKIVWFYGKDKDLCKQKIFEYKVNLLQEAMQYHN